MNWKIFFLLFICWSYITQSQNPINQAAQAIGDSNDVHMEYWMNENLRLMYTKKNGNLEGEYLYYFSNGKLQSMNLFEKGRLNGPYYNYTKESWLHEEASFAHDTILFYKQTNYYSTGEINNVIYLEFDKDSLKIFPFLKPNVGRNDVGYNLDANFSVLKSHGSQIEYHKNGNIKFEVPLINYKRQGLYKSYYENGKLYEEGNFVNDREEGEFKFYSETGELFTTDVWLNGKRIEKGKRLKFTKRKRKKDK